jgi:hypothetical protein
MYGILQCWWGGGGELQDLYMSDLFPAFNTCNRQQFISSSKNALNFNCKDNHGSPVDDAHSILAHNNFKVWPLTGVLRCKDNAAKLWASLNLPVKETLM